MPHLDFVSIGTNDLTQTTFGISRDDSGRFLQAYMDKGIFETDPFVRLDQEGVGDLIRIAAETGAVSVPSADRSDIPKSAARSSARRKRFPRR